MTEERKIVLVVEDEAPMLNVLTDSLKGSGFATFQARDGEEGLSLAFTHHPDLILLDLLMPKMDGMTMMGKLRQDKWGKHVPVIVLTNVSADTDATLKAIVAYQPAYYLVKSDVKLEGIIEKIKDVLAKNSSH